jgi:anti-sigma factor ChrR (cupin superfamily)
MQHDHALIERLVTEFIAGYMSHSSGDYFVGTFTDSETRVQVIREVTQAAFTYALHAAAQGRSEEGMMSYVEQAGFEFLPSIGG